MLPAPALRGLLGGFAVAMLVSVVAAAPAGRATWASVVTGTALVAWVVASPASPAPTVLLLLAAVVVLDAGPPALPLLVAQAACVSAVHLLAALCALAPRDARWETAALRPALRRWVLAQAVCLPVALVAVGARGAALGPGLDVAAGLLGLLLLAGLVALARRRRAPDGGR